MVMTNVFGGPPKTAREPRALRRFNFVLQLYSPFHLAQQEMRCPLASNVPNDIMRPGLAGMIRGVSTFP